MGADRFWGKVFSAGHHFLPGYEKAGWKKPVPFIFIFWCVDVFLLPAVFCCIDKKAKGNVEVKSLPTLQRRDLGQAFNNIKFLLISLQLELMFNKDKVQIWKIKFLEKR